MGFLILLQLMTLYIIRHKEANLKKKRANDKKQKNENAKGKEYLRTAESNCDS